MKVLFIASEITPLVKTGGLADVIGALPKSLRELGSDVHIAMPDYPVIDSKHLTYVDRPQLMRIHTPRGDVDCFVSQVLLPGTDIPVHLFRTGRGLANHSLYPTEDEGEQDRFLLFSLAVVQWLKSSVWQPDVVHCHDWMTGAIPQLLDQYKLTHPALLTIHNLYYQGVVPTIYFDDYNIKTTSISPQVNLLRMGIQTATKINTVSKTYAKEALTVEYGCGLEQALTKRKSDFSGILNGIDYDLYNPTKNSFLAQEYGADSVIEGKQVNKGMLQEELGLEVRADAPLYGYVARLTDQKGLDLIEKALQSTPVLQHGQVVILGQGDAYWERRLRLLAQKHEGAMSVKIEFNEALAHRIYAASDFTLIPSKFEPCGLTQMIAMKFGSLPIVRKTGGLADTVVDIKQHPKLGTGLVFEPYSAKEFSQVLGGSARLYKQSAAMHAAISRAMKQDFSWQKSAEKYLDLYQEMLQKS